MQFDKFTDYKVQTLFKELFGVNYNTGNNKSFQYKVYVFN